MVELGFKNLFVGVGGMREDKKQLQNVGSFRVRPWLCQGRDPGKHGR